MFPQLEVANTCWMTLVVTTPTWKSCFTAADERRFAKDARPFASRSCLSVIELELSTTSRMSVLTGAICTVFWQARLEVFEGGRRHAIEAARAHTATTRTGTRIRGYPQTLFRPSRFALYSIWSAERMKCEGSVMSGVASATPMEMVTSIRFPSNMNS